jgi:SAM-dependent methyltransferase
MAAPLPAWAAEFSDLSGAVDLAADCATFLEQRQAKMGVDGSGLYNFYAQRVASNQMFALYELRMTRFCADKLRAFETFVEVGCGVGQLPFLMALQGQKCIGIDNDWKRAACAGDLKLHLVERYPLIAANARIMYGAFPAALPDGVDKERCVLLCNCLVFTHTPEQALAFVREMHTYPLSIIDLTRFLQIRRDEASRQELLDLLDAEGFETPEPLGPTKAWDGEFVALTPRR